MRIIFNKLIMHNFLSYGYTELDLSNKHYCLVKGINNYKKDNSQSNGSGKSSWSSAICFALTGSTISGINSNLKNININENLCYVTLYFSIDNNNYVISRYKNPKPDLKIILNDIDISGKGIRESEAILRENLPDISIDLLSSIIILGQGLPNKFTANSPSGRKELLEQLAKSDFMIQDLKLRITKRSDELNKNLRSVEDNLLSSNSKKQIWESQLKEVTENYEKLKLKKLDEYDIKLNELKNIIDDLNSKKNLEKNNLLKLEKEINYYSTKLSEVLNNKSNSISAENVDFDTFHIEYLNKKSKLEVEITTLKNKITELKSIKDICPTCGQKIPNVIKQDTTKEETELQEKILNLNEINKKYSDLNKIHLDLIKNINESFDSDISEINFSIKKSKEAFSMHQGNLYLIDENLNNANTEKNSILLEKENYKSNIENMEKTLYNINLNIKKLNEDILYNNKEKENILDHVKIINQLNNLIKRDFRGYLLKNIIEYISIKIKEYCEIVFGNQELEFYLDGNNINISYLNKDFENLSGGEKQKIDLIIQFAIRDMMETYLNFSSNILILDEVFDQLDMLGCNKILDLVSDKLNDVESLFIISHRSDELEIPCDCELVVIKNAEGISNIIWQ